MLFSKHGWCRDSVGVDPVDALRDVVNSRTAVANRCVHGRVQYVHRESADRDVAHRAADIQQRVRRRSEESGRARWDQFIDCGCDSVGST